MTAIAAQAQDVNTIFGAMIVGGIVAIIVGLTIKQIRKVFPPLVTELLSLRSVCLFIRQPLTTWQETPRTHMK